MVFVHGWAATARLWQGVTEELSTNYTTVALDLRGHGNSDKDPGLDYSVDRMERDLEELIDRLRLRDHVLAGHCMGGIIAARCASKMEGCAGLVLTGVPWEVKGGVSLVVMDVLMRMRWLAERFVTPRMFAPGAREELLEFVRRESARSPTGVLRSILRNVSGAVLPPEMGESSIPKLVIAGEHDAVVPVEDQKEVADRLKARLVVIQGAGHNVMLEKPKEFGQSMHDFARFLPASPG